MGFFDPADFKISRETTVAAPAAAAFGLVDDLRRWEGWNPWKKMDPSSKESYDGPAAGAGASSAWEGKKTGSGRMTIVESRTGQLVRLKLEFFKPMKAVNEAVFAFSPDGGGTRVTWTMTGRRPFMAKLMCALLNMDAMLGRQFEQGLRDLKAIAEGGTGK